MPSVIRLELPSDKYKDSYIAAVIENQNNPIRNQSDAHYDNIDIEKAKADFYGYVVLPKLDKMDKDKIPVDRVPGTEYWIIDKDGYAGRISLRHYLNEALKNDAGHIGYDVIPGKRGRGYAKEALLLALEKAREKEIDEVILACFTDYTPSRKVIENAMQIMGGRVIKNYESDGKENIQFAVRTSNKKSIVGSS